jgi:nicotinic acetylcholine receptor
MNSKAMVSHNGNVFWPPPTKFRSTCPVDVTYFPFDDQTCIMKLGSWTYDGFQVVVSCRAFHILNDFFFSYLELSDFTTSFYGARDLL